MGRKAKIQEEKNIIFEDYLTTIEKEDSLYILSSTDDEDEE